MQSTVVVIHLDDRNVTATEAEAGVTLPLGVEPMDLTQLDRAEGVDEVAEHP